MSETAPPPYIPTISSADLVRLRQQNPDLWLDPDTKCLTCKKQGKYLTVLPDGTQDIVSCDCTQQWALYLFLLNAGIGIRYQRLGWQHARRGVAPYVLTRVEDYLANADAYASNGLGMTFWSSSRGSGKTMMATLILKNLLDRGYDGYFCLFNQLLNLHTAGWRDAEARRWFEYRVTNAAALVIDDMGKENANRADMTNALVDEILRTRIAHARPTFVTTNLDMSEMKKRYYSDAVELFTECNELVEMAGESYRPKVQEEALRGIQYPIVVG